VQRTDLNGVWSLRYCSPGAGERLGWPASGATKCEAIAARVPGCAHLDLTEAGNPRELSGECNCPINGK
jgi:hypothetical protein